MAKASLADVPELFDRFKVRSTPTFVLVVAKGNGLHQRFRHMIKKNQLVAQIQYAIRLITHDDATSD